MSLSRHDFAISPFSPQTRVTGDEPRKTEPKPMIDNPNAAATKANNIIRPMPLKMPDSEQRMTGN